MPVTELSIAEKLRLAESLWDALSHDSAGKALVVPNWHRTLLNERAGHIDSGQDPTSTWEEAKRRLHHATAQSW